MTTLKEYIKTVIPSMLFHSQMHPTYNGKVANKLWDVYVVNVEEFLHLYNTIKEQAKGKMEVIFARHDTKQKVCFKLSSKGIFLLTDNNDPNQERLYFLPRNK